MSAVECTVNATKTARHGGSDPETRRKLHHRGSYPGSEEIREMEIDMFWHDPRTFIRSRGKSEYRRLSRGYYVIVHYSRSNTGLCLTESARHYTTNERHARRIARYGHMVD